MNFIRMMYGGQATDPIQKEKNANRVAAGLRSAGVQSTSIIVNGEEKKVATERYVQTLEQQINLMRKQIRKMMNEIEKLSNAQKKSNKNHNRFTDIRSIQDD